MKIGQQVVWNDDGQECFGVVEEVIAGGGRGTHLGNLYVCRFTDEEEESSYTRNFDDHSLGNELQIRKLEI